MDTHTGEVIAEVPVTGEGSSVLRARVPQGGRERERENR